MRQISPKAIIIFSTLTTINVVLNALISVVYYQITGAFQNIIYILIPLTFYLTTILTYRLLFYHMKFPLHQIPKNSAENITSQLYVLFYLIYFNLFVHNTLLPVPLSRMFHQLLGAKFGSGSYSAGIILDPPYFEIGENSIIGFGSVVCAHAFEGENVSFEKIIVGSNVTIGLRAILLPGVRIEDNAIVAAGSLVTKNTHIKNGEIWAGIPAKKVQLSQNEIIPSIANYAS